MYLLDSIRKLPLGHLNSSLGKNLSQYLPIRAWLVIALVAHAHNKLEWPNNCSQGPSLV